MFASFIDVSTIMFENFLEIIQPEKTEFTTFWDKFLS